MYSATRRGDYVEFSRRATAARINLSVDLRNVVLDLMDEIVNLVVVMMFFYLCLLMVM